MTPVPANRIFLNAIYNGNTLLAHNLQPSDAGTFTCSASIIGNFSAQLTFIGTNLITYMYYMYGYGNLLLHQLIATYVHFYGSILFILCFN